MKPVRVACAITPRAGRGGRVLIAMLVCLLLPSAFAHEVQHGIAVTPAAVVTLSYADGRPFSYEAFEVFAAGSDQPFQVGRTDAQGRAAFLPPAAGEVRFRASSADGHGVDLRMAPPRADAVAAAPAAGDRNAKLVLGIGILLALFGLVQLFLCRKKAA